MPGEGLSCARGEAGCERIRCTGAALAWAAQPGGWQQVTGSTESHTPLPSPEQGLRHTAKPSRTTKPSPNPLQPVCALKSTGNLWNGLGEKCRAILQLCERLGIRQGRAGLSHLRTKHGQASAGLLFLDQQPVCSVKPALTLAKLTYKFLQRGYEPPWGQGGL